MVEMVDEGLVLVIVRAVVVETLAMFGMRRVTTIIETYMAHMLWFGLISAASDGTALSYSRSHTFQSSESQAV